MVNGAMDTQPAFAYRHVRLGENEVLQGGRFAQKW